MKSIKRKIDYGKFINNFDRDKDVKSLLVSGDLDKVKNPYISIVIPTYRRPGTLKQAIDSAINQSNVSFEYEIIVVDNEPSSDSISETEELIKTYDCYRLYYYKNVKNMGMFGNWNRCIELSRGKWISFLHDDDLLKEECLSITEKIIVRNEKGKKRIGYIKFNAEPFYGKNMNSTFATNKNKGIKGKIQGAFGNKLMRFNKCDVIIDGNAGMLGFPTCGTLVNREAIIKVGGYNQDHYPSADIHPPFLMLNDYRVYRTIVKLGFYRWDDNASYKKETMKGWAEEYYAFSKYLEQSSPILGIFVRVFRKEQYASFIQYVLELSGQKNLGLRAEDFDEIYEYKPNKFKSIMLNIIKKTHYYYKLSIAFFIG